MSGLLIAIPDAARAGGGQVHDPAGAGEEGRLAAEAVAGADLAVRRVAAEIAGRLLPDEAVRLHARDRRNGIVDQQGDGVGQGFHRQCLFRRGSDRPNPPRPPNPPGPRWWALER